MTDIIRRRHPGADATLGNIGPDRPPIHDPEELDAIKGTTSGARLRGTPQRGQRERTGYGRTYPEDGAPQ